MSNTESKIPRIFEEIDFKDQLANLAEKTTTLGGIIVCTNKLSAEQIDEARRKKNLAVSPDGIGFARVPVKWIHKKGRP